MVIILQICRFSLAEKNTKENYGRIMGLYTI